MSRIGSTPITIPTGVDVQVDAQRVTVKGAQGQLLIDLKPGINVKVDDHQIVVSRQNDQLFTKACHGLVRSLINNAVTGVSQGFKKTLKLVGTGYRVTPHGQGLSLSLGYSHPVVVAPTPGVTFSLEGNDTIYVAGIDRQSVGQVAANIRSLRPPEPYKGKGIRYLDEVVIRKQGKAAAK